MKISSSFSNTNRGLKNQSFKGIPKTPKYIPEFIGKIGKVAGEYISMPEQKLFLAATALMFQPLIDLKFANDEQKNDAAIKSASKAIAGGITGVAIRAGFLKITDHFIGFNKHNKLNTHFFPDAAVHLQETRPEIAKLYMKQYSKTLGTLFAILFMILFSNSKIDVPLTNDLQDLISGVSKENKTWLQSLNDVIKNRGKKISAWFKKEKESIKGVEDKASKVFNVLKENPKTKESKEDSR